MSPRSFQLNEIPSTESTQDLAKNWLSEHRLDIALRNESYWVRSNTQSAGRGRAGRSWLSAEPGSGLLCSCAFWFASPTLQKNLVPLVAGFSLFECLQEWNSDLAKNLAIKWPNDVGVFTENGTFRKIAGVLVESPFKDALAVGWGLNISQSPAELPHATSIAELLKDLGLEIELPSPSEFLSSLRNSFLLEIGTWESEKNSYEKLFIQNLKQGPMAALWGRKGKLENGEEAIARSLEADGALLVELATDGSTKKVYAGDFRF